MLHILDQRGSYLVPIGINTELRTPQTCLKLANTGQIPAKTLHYHTIHSPSALFRDGGYAHRYLPYFGISNSNQKKHPLPLAPFFLKSA
jgi:hypothetical protein